MVSIGALASGHRSISKLNCSSTLCCPFYFDAARVSVAASLIILRAFCAVRAWVRGRPDGRKRDAEIASEEASSRQQLDRNRACEPRVSEPQLHHSFDYVFGLAL